jgi:hypothetical protein
VAILTMTPKQDYVPQRGDHERSEAHVFDGFRHEVPRDGEQRAAQAKEKWPRALVVRERRPKNGRIGDEGHQDERSVKALVLDEPDARAGKHAAERSQAQRTQRASEQR